MSADVGNLVRTVAFMGATAALLAVPGPPGASAAGFGGDCCADLEERVSELETTVARKGNRKMSLTIGGVVNRGILFWDDGVESDAYSINNDNDASLIALEGEAEIGGGWSAGFVLEFDAADSLSSEVNQTDDDAGEGFVADASENHIWIRHENLGTLTWGEASAGSDGATEYDLSGATNASYAAVIDVGGGFFLRRSDVAGPGGLLGLKWEDVIDDLNGASGDVVRYDTPELAGFTLSAAWGEDDLWDVGLRYEKEFEDFLEIAGGIGYHVDQDEGENTDAIVGSISALHIPSGLNLTFASGKLRGNDFVDLNDGSTAKPDDKTFFYVKGGLKQQFNSLGDTAFYGEYGRFKNFLGRDTEAEDVAELGGIDEVDVCAAGLACLVAGTRATIWGLGVVQYIDAAAMQLYLGYRHHEIDVDLVDSAGVAVPGVPLTDFDTILAGGVIEF